MLQSSLDLTHLLKFGQYYTHVGHLSTLETQLPSAQEKGVSEEKQSLRNNELDCRLLNLLIVLHV